MQAHTRRSSTHRRLPSTLGATRHTARMQTHNAIRRLNDREAHGARLAFATHLCVAPARSFAADRAEVHVLEQACDRVSRLLGRHDCCCCCCCLARELVCANLRVARAARERVLTCSHRQVWVRKCRTSAAQIMPSNERECGRSENATASKEGRLVSSARFGPFCLLERGPSKCVRPSSITPPFTSWTSSRNVCVLACDWWSVETDELTKMTSKCCIRLIALLATLTTI